MHCRRTPGYFERRNNTLGKIVPDNSNEGLSETVQHFFFLEQRNLYVQYLVTTLVGKPH